MPESDNNKLGIYSLYSLDANKTHGGKYTVELEINGKECKMGHDATADYSITSKSEYSEKFADRPLSSPIVTLRTYTGELLNVSGEMQCDIVYRGKKYYLPVVVANYDSGPTLLGKS